MSPALHPFPELPHLASLPNVMTDVSSLLSSSFADPYHSQKSPSSSARASSPPGTPYAPRHIHDYAHIRSSPRLEPFPDFRTTDNYHDSSHSAWRGLVAPYMDLKPRPHHYLTSSSRSTSRIYGPPSDFDASESSEDVGTGFDSAQPGLVVRKAPFQSPSNLLDPFNRDDEEQDEGQGFSFSELGIRTMCFRTSAERGRWKTDPMPSQRAPLSTRNSVPATQSATDVLVVPRPISEPAPSIPTPGDPVLTESDNQNEGALPEVTSVSSPVTLSSPPTSPMPGSMETLPPLTSDRDSSMDVDEVLTPSSPLPPSSPPFSPASSPALLPARSLSPRLSSPPSPLMTPSSPLSSISSEIGDEDAYGLALTQLQAAERDVEETSDQDGIGATLNSDSTPTPHDHSACAPVDSSIIKLNLSQSGVHIMEPSIQQLSSSPSGNAEQIPQEAIAASTAMTFSPYSTTITPLDESIAGNSGESSRTTTPTAKDVSQRRSTTNEPRKGNQDKTKENIEPSKENYPSSATTADSASTSKKRPKTKQEPRLKDGPARKRVKTADSLSRNGKAPSTSPVPQEEKARAGVKKRHKEPAVSETSILAPRKSKPTGDDSDLSAPSSRAPSVLRLRPPLDDSKRDQNGVLEEDAEICGMIIEGMATSRASSLPITSICKIVMQSRPSMKAERGESEWHDVFDRVLHSGAAGRGSGVFGKVDSSYKDDHDRSAEARWFYVPEMDCDQERAGLIRSMMPRPAKRSETKKYKQYYYQPLDKISRWDPEDDL